ncbi:MAG: Uma2 family endonuclease [Armatimonadota bacterium]|nr:Uma2 family endonuclease [Armatimonadota bacterium]
MAQKTLEAREEIVHPGTGTRPAMLESPWNDIPLVMEESANGSRSGDNEEETEYYYDWHPTEEDLMGQSAAQFGVIHYIVEVLRWLYRTEGWFIPADLNIYRTRNKRAKPIVPDIAVFKGVVADQVKYIRSWPLPRPNRPAPTVVFEFASDDTWRKDVEKKPADYASMGVPEYFLFDPREIGEAVTPRLRGWEAINGIATPLVVDDRGWLWSHELDSWLGVEGEVLRLYDADGVIRLTGEEAERAAREQEQAAREREQAAKERAWAKLRELGFDPESLE